MVEEISWEETEKELGGKSQFFSLQIIDAWINPNTMSAVVLCIIICLYYIILIPFIFELILSYPKLS